MARSRSGLRFRPSLEPRDFALRRWCASFWFRRRAHASHFAVISAVDLANGQGRGLGLAHRLESGSIVNQKALCVWRKVIETTELGDAGVGARGHGGPVVAPAHTRRRSWRSLDRSLGYLGCPNADVG